MANDMQFSAIKTALNLLYPYDATCDLCACPLLKHERGLCGDCFMRLYNNQPDYRPYVPLNVRVVSPMGYTGDAIRLIHGLKYNNKRYLSHSLGELMLRSLADGGINPDCIVPVPLHKDRLRSRGYNQTLLIAQYLSERLNKPVLDAIERVRATDSQAGIVSASYRAQNMKGAFRIKADSGLCGKAVLIIDDVITTGATMLECIQEAEKGGAASITAAAAAVTDV